MCRMVGYLGPPLPLADLLYSPPHSLEKQAYQPLELVHGHVNVDGTGVAWWEEGHPEPLHYVTEHPPWSDANLPGLASRLSGRMIISALRSATPGVGFGVDHVPPFVYGRWVMAHNGWIEGLDGKLGQEMLSAVGSELVPKLSVWNDSRLLFLLWLTQLVSGLDLVSATRETLHQVSRLCRQLNCRASLNLLVGDGDVLVGARAAVGVRSNSLYSKSDQQSHWLASEPLDSDGWEPVLPGSLLRYQTGQWLVEPLDPFLHGTD